MQGIAKALFEQMRTSVATPRPIEVHRQPWPKLEVWVDEGKLDIRAFRLAQLLLEPIGAGVSQEVAAFICYLFEATKRGHLCINVGLTEIQPSPRTLFSEVEEELGFTDEECQLWQDWILQASPAFPPSLISTSPEELKVPPVPIIEETRGSQKLYYLQRFWLYEALCRYHLTRLKSVRPTVSFSTEAIDQALQKKMERKELLLEQADAISTTLENPISIITGGPGTGKSYTVGCLIEVVNAFLGEKREGFCAVLAAPTGKAAAHLFSAVSKAVKDPFLMEQISSKTLHALLEMRRDGSRRKDAPVFLDADLIVVDEASMIDAKMLSLLLATVKPGARLILIGDPHQLPAIEGGSLFADILQANFVPSVHLTRCMRTDSTPILQLAETICAGQSEGVFELFSKGTSELSLVPLEKWAFLKRAQGFTPSVELKEEEPLELIERFSSFRVLSPLRRGPLGVEAINQRLAESLLQNHNLDDQVVLPIIVTVNDYRLELFNGDTGVVICKRAAFNRGVLHFNQGDRALFPSAAIEGVRSIPALLLPKTELAFCLSVHKSQGSEFEKVLLVLPEIKQLFGREALYTAVTRARYSVEIWSQKATLQETLSISARRLSGITASKNLYKSVHDRIDTLAKQCC